MTTNRRIKKKIHPGDYRAKREDGMKKKGRKGIRCLIQFPLHGLLCDKRK